MKNPVYIRCPRCELNYILKKDRHCNVCKIEMKAQGSLGIEENLDLDLCPVCKANYISPDEDMCVSCAKEKALEDGMANDSSNDDEWENVFTSDEGSYNEDEEAGEMVAITDLEDSPLDSEGLELGLEDEDEAEKLDEEEETFDDLEDDVFDDLDEEEDEGDFDDEE